MPAIDAPIVSFRSLPEDVANLDAIARALPAATGRPFLTTTDAIRSALRVAAHAVADGSFAPTLAAYRSSLAR
jgi:hypothetical protein